MTTDHMHAAVWAAIDDIACRHGFTLGALARAAGLNRIIFGPTRRVDGSGKPCWPTTGTIAKLLAAVGMSFTEFGAMVDRHRGVLTEPVKEAA